MRALKPSARRMRETSATQWRMSPSRNRPTISGASATPIDRAIASASAATDVELPVPTLSATSVTSSRSSARQKASTMSLTWTKSRLWQPSSNTSGRWPLSRRDEKIAPTPVYGLESAWRGPYTLKSRRATVPMPYARPMQRQRSSWSRFVTAYTDVGAIGLSSSHGAGVVVVPHAGQSSSQSRACSCASGRGAGATGPHDGQRYRPSP